MGSLVGDDAAGAVAVAAVCGNMAKFPTVSILGESRILGKGLIIGIEPCFCGGDDMELSLIRNEKKRR